jgi:hypothetical protein
MTLPKRSLLPAGGDDRGHCNQGSHNAVAALSSSASAMNGRVAALRYPCRRWINQPRSSLGDNPRVRPCLEAPQRMTARTDDGNQSISKVPLQQQFQLIKLQFGFQWGDLAHYYIALQNSDSLPVKFVGMEKKPTGVKMCNLKQMAACGQHLTQLQNSLDEIRKPDTQHGAFR